MNYFAFLETLGLRRRAWRTLLALVVCAYPVLDFVKYAATVPRLRLIDLFVQYVAARVLAIQGDIYSFSALSKMADQIGTVRYGSAFSNLLLAYTHPPSDAFFDLRWTLFSWADVKLIYSWQTPLLYLAALLLLWHALRSMAPRTLHWMWPLVLWALIMPTRASLGLGQQDILILFLMTVVFWSASRGHDVLAALALALCTLMKITPAVILLYWAWRREWRLFAYGLVAISLIVLIGLPWVRVDRWIQFASQIFPAISTGTAYSQNQSLPGLVNRLLLDPRWQQGLKGAPSVPLLRVINTSIELGLVVLALFFTRTIPGTAAARAGGASLMTRLLAFLRAPADSRQTLHFALGFSIWLLIQPIISPIAWDHYFTWLVFPYTVLLASMLNARLSTMRAACLALALAGSLALVNVPVQTFFAFPEAWQRSPLLYGSLIAFVVLLERLEATRPLTPRSTPAQPQLSSNMELASWSKSAPGI